jgi:hypothetical protein
MRQSIHILIYHHKFDVDKCILFFGRNKFRQKTLEKFKTIYRFGDIRMIFFDISLLKYYENSISPKSV